MTSNIVLSASTISMLMLLAKATLILVAALGITLSMQRASAGARHLVWLVTLATLMLVPALTAWAPIPLRVLPAASVETPLSAPSVTNDLATTPGTKIENTAPDAGNPANGAPASPSIEQEITSSPVLSGISILLLVWAVVVLAIASSLAYAALMVKRIVSRARPLSSEDWVTPLWEVSDRLSLEEPPRLLRSEDAKMPFACGLFNPTIVLPAECDTWSLDRRRAVLLHELAHVRRHDLVGHTLGRLACAFYWFHPLVWTAAKQLRSESERACDDLALTCGARAADYAEHLLDIVTSVRHDATPSVALAMARRKEFEGRMLAILDPELRHSSPSRRQSAALIASLAMIALVVGAAAPAPRLPSESSSVPASVDLSLASAQKNAAEVGSIGEPDGDAPHQHTSTRTSTSTQTSTTTNTVISPAPLVSAAAQAGVRAAVWVGVNAGMTAGMNVSRATIMSVIGKQGADKGTDERAALLAKVLATDTSASLRRVAAWGLNDYADGQVAAEALANALRHDRDAGVREMAAWSLSDADHSSVAIEALIAALRSDSNLDVRKTAAWALGNIGDRSSAQALAAALSDASPEIRKRAAWALGNTDLHQAPPQLIAMLNDKDPEMREVTAWALYQIEDPAAIPGLEGALGRESSKELQMDYIRALAATGEKSVDALKGLLESRDPEIRNIAVRALAGGNATGPWPRPWPEPRPFPND
jgi:beta-lactamase regulating signal transducer with metallopeptidase domain/HEAT repeat protein